MPEETPVVDCFKCSDLAFARNLAAQMREGYGRHNSNLSFRSQRQGRLVSFGNATVNPDELFESWRNLRENQQARVIGRVGGHNLRQKWEDCEIGDAVKEESDEQFLFFGANQVLFVDRIAQDQRLSFERVGMPMTPDDGHTWNDEYLWKRIS